MKSPLIAAIAAVVIGGGYYASPYVATKNLASAVQEGDRRELDDRVDFPGIRQSLKDQVNAAMSQHMAKEMQDNPFAALGAAFASKLVEGMVDSMITPAGLATMMQDGKAPKNGQRPATTSGSKKEVNWEAAKSMGFTGLTEFTIELENEEKPGTSMLMIMELDGFGWKLTDIDITEAFSEI